MKIIISTIIGAILFFALGYLFYAVMFMDYFSEAYATVQREMESLRFWALIAANISQALLISIIYSKYFNKGGSPLMQGFACGFWLGLYLSVPYVFYTYFGMRINNWQALVLDGVIAGFMVLIVSIVIALIQGKKKTESTAATASA